MSKNLVIGGLVVALSFALGGLWLAKPAPTQVIQAPVGAFPGGEIFNRLQLRDSVYISRFSGLDDVLPGVTGLTVSATQVCDESVIDVSVGTLNAIVTLPSSTPVFNRCLNRVGQHREFFIQNATTSDEFTLTVSDGSSTLKATVNSSSTTITSEATTTLLFGDFVEIKAGRGTSSSQPWLFWLVNVYRGAL